MKNDNIYEIEYGTSMPINWETSRLFDSEGKEIEVPKCEKCGNYKNCLSGKESYIWICGMGCVLK